MKAAIKDSEFALANQLPLPFDIPKNKLSRADRAIIRHVNDGLIRADFATGLVYKRGHERPSLGKRNHDGYLRLGLNEPDWRNQIPVFVHRIIAYSLWGYELFRLEVNHINEVKADNRACNLELVTRDQNMRHSMCGAKNHMTILTAEQVREIRRRYQARGAENSGRALAAEFGTTYQNISNIVLGNSWKHLK